MECKYVSTIGCLNVRMLGAWCGGMSHAGASARLKPESGPRCALPPRSLYDLEPGLASGLSHWPGDYRTGCWSPSQHPPWPPHMGPCAHSDS